MTSAVEVDHVRQAVPDLNEERRMLRRRACRLVAGMDEVGRGAWAGPLVVGVVVVDASTGSLPEGVKDSKLLSATARSSLEPAISEWCAAWALGEASPDEIDEFGLSWALSAAAWRALDALSVRPDVVLVDGCVDIVHRHPRANGIERPTHEGGVPPAGPEVRAIIKGDRTAGSIAAASVLAKVGRDRQMTALADDLPLYGFERHKGYGTADHEAALVTEGLSKHHRRSWAFARRLCPGDPTLLDLSLDAELELTARAHDR
ncbi:MAG TPA: ribonuclease HII [Acidimicrobiales bacterium]